MSINILSGTRPTRRRLLQGAAGLGGLASLPFTFQGAEAEEAALSVFSPLPPDPAPPGAAKFSEEAFATWQKANAAKVNYDMVAWPQLHDKMATTFAAGGSVWDIVYMSGWVPEFAKFLTPSIPPPSSP